VLADRLQGGQDLDRFNRRMFAIDQDPIKPRPAKHLRHRIAADGVPDAKLRLPCFQGRFEQVFRVFHRRSFKLRRG
jgi:hypothetical protein